MENWASKLKSKIWGGKLETVLYKQQNLNNVFHGNYVEKDRNIDRNLNTRFKKTIDSFSNENDKTLFVVDRVFQDILC